MMLIGLVHGYRRVAGGNAAVWDERLGTRVAAPSASLGRTILTATAYFVPIGAIAALSAASGAGAVEYRDGGQGFH